MKRKQIRSLIPGLILILGLAINALAQEGIDQNGGSDMENVLRLFLDDTEVAVAWEENDSVRALAELAASAPLTVQMSMYGGFEQVGALGTSLPRNDDRISTQAGDIALYSGNQIVIFYGSNTWAYTRLGRITDRSAAELAELLGVGDITMTLSFEERKQ